MNQRYNKSKIFAFTLAEMMVILLVFSVIAAATLPVVSMRQKLGNVDNNAMSDYPGVDKWSYSQIGSTGQYALSNIGAGVYSTVAIGMEPTAADVPFGTKPQLMINKDGEVTRTSHITFLGTMGSNVYYNGRLSMAGENVALGNDALWSTQTSGAYATGVGERNVVIGKQAAYRYPLVTTDVNDDTKLHDTIAIGYKAFYSGTGPYNVVVGTYAGYSQYGRENIMMGTWAGYYSGAILKKENIYLGTYAGFGQYSITNNAINIGYHSGRYQYGITTTSPINIGYYSGLYQVKASDNPINIGTYAGKNQNVYSSNKVYDPINIGYFAGYSQNGSKTYISNPINIGFYAGRAQYSASNYGYNAIISHPINIGKNAGWGQYSMKDSTINSSLDYPINIGTDAGVDQYSLANTEINRGLASPVNIGRFAGKRQHTQYETSLFTPINIGNLAGCDQVIAENTPSDFFGPINIGFAAGYYARIYGVSSISIGAEAGDNDESKSDIRIGHHRFSMSVENSMDPSTGFADSDYDYILSGTDKIQRFSVKLFARCQACYDDQSYNSYCSDYEPSGGEYDYDQPMVKYRSYIGHYPHRDVFDITKEKYESDYSSDWYNINNMAWAPMSSVMHCHNNLMGGDVTLTEYANYGQLIISGGNNYSAAMYKQSSILLYSSHLYGPKSTFETYSDKRLKKNIVKSRYSLKDLRKINIYEYNFKEDKEKSPRIGVIAQELQKIIPQAVTNINDGYLAISAEWINYTLINSIKELASQIDVIQKEFTSYVKEFVTLVARVNTLEKQIKNLEQENKVLLTSVDKAYRKAKARK